MDLESHNHCFDGVLFAFKGGLVNSLDLCLFGFATLLRETRDGGTKTLSPCDLQNLIMVIWLQWRSLDGKMVQTWVTLLGPKIVTEVKY